MSCTGLPCGTWLTTFTTICSRMHCVALSDDDDDVIVSVCWHGPTRERDLKERKVGTMAVRPSSVKRIGCLM